MTNKLKENKGFTLIEVIVAIAILALLSGGLLEAFVLSTKMNSKADNIDKANLLATQVAEDFKSGAQADLFYKGEAVSVFTDTESVLAGSERQYTKWYNASWNEETSRPTSGFVLRAKINLNTKGSSTDAFTPQTAAAITLSATSPDSDSDGFADNNLVINTANLSLNGSGNTSYVSSTGRTGIRINYPNGQTAAIAVNVTNNSTKPVDLYVYGVSESTPANTVKLVPVQGESSISYINSASSTNLNEYTIEVSIERLDDNVNLSRITTSKYLAQTGG